MNGNAIIITATSGGNQIIAAAKSGEIQTECGTIEIASSAQSDWEWNNFIKGRKSWSVTVSYLVTNVANIRKMLNVGETYTLSIYQRGMPPSGGNPNLTGSAILTTCKQTYTRGNLIGGTFVFKGTGSLT